MAATRRSPGHRARAGARLGSDTGPWRVLIVALLGLLAWNIPVGPAWVAPGPTALHDAGPAAPPVIDSDLGPSVRSGRADPGPLEPAKGSAGPSTPTTAANLSLGGSTVMNLTHSTTVDNIEISGSAELVFGNSSWTATLTILGNVYLLGSGRLYLWDTYVDLVGSYTGERTVYLNDSAHAVLNEAFVSSDNVGWNGEISDDANLTVLSSALEWHSVLQFHDNSTFYSYNSKVEADVQPSGGVRITQEASAGSALWFPFYDGNTGTFSFPAADVETNWSFPPSGATGISYRVLLRSDWPALFAVTQYPGSNITIRNTAGIDETFLPVNGAIEGSGFRFGENANFTFATTQFRLHLDNVSIDSWSFYPVNSTLTLDDSQLGEVMGWGGSEMTLEDSNLTDLGGYYATFENSRLTIANCTVGSTVTAYDSGRILLENSTVIPNESVLAVNDGTIDAVNVTLDPGASYAAQESGLVRVEEPLTVAVAFGGVPVEGARVSLRSTVGPGLNDTNRTGPSGTARFYPVSEQVAATGNRSLGAVSMSASSGLDIASATLDVAGPTTWDAALEPLVRSTFPGNGTREPAGSWSVNISFGFPMNESSVAAALRMTPAVAVSLAWSLSATNLSIVPAASWPPGTTVNVSIGTGASTASGLDFPLPFGFEFVVPSGIAPLPAPTLAGSTPSNGASGVGLFPTIVVTFSLPMDPTTTAAAFAIQPSVPGPSPTVNGSALFWTGAGPLDPGTDYSVTIGSTASALDGEPLSVPASFRFETVPASAVPRALSESPSNGSTLSASPEAIEIHWSVPMDPSETALAFAIVPAEPGNLAIVGANLTWTPSSPLPPNTTYTVYVGLGARSAPGVPLLTPFWTSFRVQNSEGPSGLGPVGRGAASGPALLWWVLGAAAGVAIAGFAVGYWTRGAAGRRQPGPEPGDAQSYPP